jgi:hypothetical protein
MNKFVKLLGYDGKIGKNKYHEFFKKFTVIMDDYNSVDDILENSYGLKCKDSDGLDYDVIDESKFALFLLEHSDHIEKVSYE